MSRPVCEICAKLATIHETLIGPAQTVVRHLCDEHGKDVVPAIGDQLKADWIQSLETHCNSLEAEIQNVINLYGLGRPAPGSEK